MTTKRKQQTVQFLFEASPENNITRCLISTTSNIFENNEEQNGSGQISSATRGFNLAKESDGIKEDGNIMKTEGGCEEIATEKVTKTKKSSNTFENNEKRNDFKQLSSAIHGSNEYTECDEHNDHIIKKEEGCEQFFSEKNISLKHPGSKIERSSSTNNDNENSMINTMPKSEDIATAITHEENRIKNRCGYEPKEQNVCAVGDFYSITHPPQSLEIHLDQNTVTTSTCCGYHNNFHNTIPQSTQSNPEDKESQDQFPIVADSNHLEAKHESTKLLLNIGGKNKDRECEVIDNFNATIYDENESKYLHVIDYDMQEPASVIRNFDYSETGRQGPKLSKSNDNKKSGISSEINNNFNASIRETESNYLHDYKPERQLPDLVNPQRLHKKQTKQHASLLSNNNDIDTGNEYKFEEDFLNTKQSGSKVRNLVHDYELHVQENDGHHRSEEKRGDQFKNISYPKCENTAIPLHDDEYHSRIEENRITYIRPSSLEQPSHILGETYKQSLSLYKSELGSEECITLSATEGHNISNPHSKPKESNQSFLSDSNPVELSPNGSNTNSYNARVGEHRLTISNNVNIPSPLDNRELGSKYQFQQCTSDPHVTKAHWYDISSTLEQPSRRIPPSNTTTITTTITPSTEENPFRELPPAVNYDTAKVRHSKDQTTIQQRSNQMRHKKWKSLGELDRMSQAEEYKLPDQLSKTEIYLTNQHGISHRNDDLHTMYFSPIRSNHEYNSIPRSHAIQNTQTISSGLYANSTETLSSGVNTAKQSPFLTRKKNAPTIYNTNNAERIRSNFDTNNVETLSSDFRTAKHSPSLTRKIHAPNMHNRYSTQMSSPGFDINNRKSISPATKTAKESPSLTRKDRNLTGHIQQVNNHPDSSSLFHQTNDHGNISSSSSTLVTLDQSPIKRSPLLRRKHEKLSGTIQNVNNSSDSLLFHQTRDRGNNLKDHDNNLSSSLTALATLDQSPMKRSQKIKNLVNIEYYDINSDEELNSKIKRRPRTKSLNEEDKTTMEYVAPRREFKSSGDLRSLGLSQEEINAGSKPRERQKRTHGKYNDLHMASTAYNSSSQELIKPKKNFKTYDRHSQGQIPTYDAIRTSVSSHKPNPAMKTRSRVENVNGYDRQSQGRTPSDDTTIDSANSKNNHYLTQTRESPLVSDTSKRITVEGTHKGNHLRSDNTNIFTSNLKQNKNRVDNGTKHYGKNIEVSTPTSAVKRLPSPLYSTEEKTDNNQKHYGKYVRDATPKYIVYPIEDLKASEGKYNIARAEEEWRKRYGRLPYTNKDPLHQSSDKDFGRLFQNAEGKSMTQSNSSQTGPTKIFSLEETIGDTSSSSVFSPNSSVNGNSSSNSHSKEFSTTLHQLSSYVLSGYKGNLSQTSPLGNQGETKAEVTVRYRRYYVDDEGDLSHILDDPNESRKLSMLVHCIIRLREVYSIQPFIKTQTEEHPINLGNPQLRDAIQNKPMSVVKDIILANKSVDINTRSQSGNSALHRAAIEGDIDAIRIMINEGANVNMRDKYGFQPVHQALRYHHYKAAMFLMDCCTDLISYTSKRIQQFVTVKAIAKQYLRQTLKTPF